MAGTAKNDAYNVNSQSWG